MAQAIGVCGLRFQNTVDETLEALILDLLDWLTVRDRTYEELMDAWRTSCPRFPVWEDANDRGLIVQEKVNGNYIVKTTPSGIALLAKCDQRFRRNIEQGGANDPNPV